MRACVFFSHLSHLLSLLSVYLPFSLLSVLFSLLPLGASLARFARELSDTLLEERCACVPNVWPSSF